MDGAAGLMEACERFFRAWVNCIIIESFEYTSPLEGGKMFYRRKQFVGGF